MKEIENFEQQMELNMEKRRMAKKVELLKMRAAENKLTAKEKRALNKKVKEAVQARIAHLEKSK